MPFATVQDVAASWERYARFAPDADGALPHGLILHAAGPTDEGFRIIEIWDSEDAWRGARPQAAAALEASHLAVPPVLRTLPSARVVLGDIPVPPIRPRR